MPLGGGRNDCFTGVDGSLLVLKRSLGAVAALAAVTAFAFAPAARADTVPFVSDGAQPWASGATVLSPLESHASALARTISGNPGAEVRCEDEAGWQSLSGTYNITPTTLGFVLQSRLIELKPTVCDYLQRFALATTKPTKCHGVKKIAETVYEAQTVPVTVTKQVEVKVPVITIRTVKVIVKGKQRTKKVKVTVWKTVTKTVTEQTTKTEQVPRQVEREVAGPDIPCYAPAGHAAVAGLPDSYWRDYYSFVISLHTLSHEIWHTAPIFDEAITDCRAMQRMRDLAMAFGASADDAASIALYDWTRIYPAQKDRGPYWSADCRENGPLDLSPNDGIWP